MLYITFPSGFIIQAVYSSESDVRHIMTTSPQNQDRLVTLNWLLLARQLLKWLRSRLHSRLAVRKAGGATRKTNTWATSCLGYILMLLQIEKRKWQWKNKKGVSKFRRQRDLHNVLLRIAELYILICFIVQICMLTTERGTVVVFLYSLQITFGEKKPSTFLIAGNRKRSLEI